MPQRLVQPAVLLSAITRSVFSNTVAGLITALLLGYWMPGERIAPTPERAAATFEKEPGPLNVDPISGKLLDRIAGAAAPMVVRPTLGPILTLYGLNVAQTHDSPAAVNAQQRSASVRPARATASKASEASQKPVQTAVPAGPELADAPQTGPEESGSWMSKLSPGHLTARVAPLGRDLASAVASRAAGAGRAVVDRLADLGL